MQQLAGYGVTLNRLNEHSIELVRNWRNQPGVAGNMEVDHYITHNEQLRWFAGLDQTACYYFIIEVKQVPIGLVHLNEFNEDQRSANVGLFIGDEQYVGTGVSLAASLLILGFAFEHLNLLMLHAKVKNSNTTAINYNTFLGFTLSEKWNDEFSTYRLTQKEFSAKKEGLLKLTRYIVS